MNRTRAVVGKERKDTRRKCAFVLWSRLLAVFLCLVSRSAFAQETPSIKEIRFAGNQVISEGSLRLQLQSAAGKPYDAALVSADIARIEKLYAERGYTLARVRDAELGNDGVLRFRILEGVIDKLRTIGNKRTHTSVFLELLELHPGIVYNEKTARADRQRLDSLGIFNEIILEPSPSDDPQKVELTARVKERRTLFVTGAAAFASGSGLIGYLDAGDTNLFGNAQSLRFQWQRGVVVGNASFDDRLQRRSAYQLSFDDPRLLRNRLAIGADVYRQETLFAPVFNSLDLSPRQFQFREGATLRLGTALSANSNASIDYRNDRVNYNDLPAGLLPASDLLNANGTVASLALRGTLDKRDRPLNPRRGQYAQLRAEFGDPGLGGSFSYNKLVGDFRTYLKMGKGTLAVRGLGGISSQRTPLSEQFWIGGYELLRGYDFDQFHGTRLALVSGEYRLPIMESIQVALFADSGYAWGVQSPVRFQDVKTGGGVGLRFITPIGPIRLDLAYGSRFRAYLSLGQIY